VPLGPLRAFQKGSEARKYFAKAIEAADAPDVKAWAKRAMAMSYAFEGNCSKTVEYEQALAVPFHNPSAAYAVPFARKKRSGPDMIFIDGGSVSMLAPFSPDQVA
jgi:hypothetical protein